MLPSPIPATLLSLLLLQWGPSGVEAARKPNPGRMPQYVMNADNTINNNYNDRYTVNITVAGTNVNVMLDTGSTDLWVAPVGGIVGPFNDTGVNATIAYGDGSNFVTGPVGFSDVEFAGFTIPSTQAFINVIESVGEESDVAQGIFGLVGLGFDSPFGSIPSALTQAGMDGTTLGKSLLTSIFDQDPTKGRFFSFSLSRVGDVLDSADASLVVSDYDDKYSAVQNAPILPQFPVDSGRWSVLTDGITVNGQDIPWTAYSGAQVPAGKTAVLYDTGTTNFLVPQEIRDAIYSAVPGAVLSKNSNIPNLKFSEDLDTWVVPCNTAVNMTTKFAGQEFPIHPLDLTDVSILIAPDGNNYTVCVGSVTNGGSILGAGLDALYGDSFLRNVYSVFSFGNDTTPPHVQILADTVTEDAAADFAQVRAEVLDGSPPELAPKDIIALFDGPNAVTSAAPGSAPTGVTDVGSATSVVDASAPGFTDIGSATSVVDASPAAPSDGSSSTCTCDDGDSPFNKAGSKAAVDLASGSSDSSSSTLDKYAPAIVGLLAVNLVLLLVIACFSILAYVRNGRTAGGASRSMSAKYAPVKLREDAPRSSFEHHDVKYSD